jgi:hypothetical protein
LITHSKRLGQCLSLPCVTAQDAQYGVARDGRANPQGQRQQKNTSIPRKAADSRPCAIHTQPIQLRQLHLLGLGHLALSCVSLLAKIFEVCNDSGQIAHLRDELPRVMTAKGSHLVWVSILGRCFASRTVMVTVPCGGNGVDGSGDDLLLFDLMHIPRASSLTYPLRHLHSLIPSNFEPAIIEEHTCQELM